LLTPLRRGLAEVASETGAEIVAGSSLKAALDLNWDEPSQRNVALGRVMSFDLSLGLENLPLASSL